MVTPETILQPNTSDVAAEVMDGEAILINITSGMYHSLDGSGGAVWELLERGHSLEQIATTLVARYDVSRERAESDLHRLAGELLEQGLVTESTEAPPPLPTEAPAERLPYAPPSLSSFRDMSDLLAIDPPMPGLQQMPEWNG